MLNEWAESEKQHYRQLGTAVVCSVHRRVPGKDENGQWKANIFVILSISLTRAYCFIHNFDAFKEKASMEWLELIRPTPVIYQVRGAPKFHQLQLWLGQ
jgi:hypothetical protein